MSQITVHNLAAVVDSREVLNQIPIHEVVNHYSAIQLFIYTRHMVSNELVLNQVPDEVICDYLIGRGFNVEM